METPGSYHTMNGILAGAHYVATIRHPSAPCNISVYATDHGICYVADNPEYTDLSTAYNVYDDRPHSARATTWAYIARVIARKLLEATKQKQIPHVTTPFQRRIDENLNLEHTETDLWSPIHRSYDYADETPTNTP